MFQDEGRFGTMTTLGREWKAKGEDFVVKVKQGRESMYSFAAVAPSTGEIIAASFEKSNTDSMDAFLDKVATVTRGKPILMILDRAAWHTTPKLSIPDSIKLLFLPPTSPELNPVEHLWKHIRTERFHNIVFDTIQAVYSAVFEEIHSLGKNALKALCACSYL